MVLDLHREGLDLRVVGRPLRYRPRQHDALPLEPEVVVESGGPVLLDDVLEPLRPARRGLLRPRRLRRHAEAALLPIFLERHAGSTSPLHCSPACATFWHGCSRSRRSVWPLSHFCVSSSTIAGTRRCSPVPSGSGSSSTCPGPRLCCRGFRTSGGFSSSPSSPSASPPPG